jgi:hypothetical protein
MDYFSKNGNIPEDSRFFIHESFGNAWAKVIARSWLYVKESSENAAKIESGKFSEIVDPNNDDKWYQSLLSNDTTNVKKALIEEGLVKLGSLREGSEDWDRWVSSKVYVLPEGGERSLTIEAEDLSGYDVNADSSVNGWSNVNGLDHTVVLTLPSAPEDEAEFAVALADYCCTGKTYVFSC